LPQTETCAVPEAQTFQTQTSLAGTFSAELVIQFAFLEPVGP
jgi:hypothetical protein